MWTIWCMRPAPERCDHATATRTVTHAPSLLHADSRSWASPPRACRHLPHHRTEGGTVIRPRRQPWSPPRPSPPSSGASAPEKLVQTLLDNIKKDRKVSIEEVIVAEEKVVFKLPKELN